MQNSIPTQGKHSTQWQGFKMPAHASTGIHACQKGLRIKAKSKHQVHWKDAGRKQYLTALNHRLIKDRTSELNCVSSLDKWSLRRVRLAGPCPVWQLQWYGEGRQKRKCLPWQNTRCDSLHLLAAFLLGQGAVRAVRPGCALIPRGCAGLCSCCFTWHWRTGASGMQCIP